MKRHFWYMISGWICILMGVLMLSASAIDTASAARVKDKIEVAGKILPLEYVNDTKIDAKRHVNKYGEKLFYGHNSSNVFGNLSSTRVGEMFTVVESEANVIYMVTEVVTFDKVSDTVLEADGQKYTMSAIANYAKGYDVALMTCAGEAYGDGDATKRLVVFANRVE